MSLELVFLLFVIVLGLLKYIPELMESYRPEKANSDSDQFGSFLNSFSNWLEQGKKAYGSYFEKEKEAEEYNDYYEMHSTPQERD